MRIGRGLPAFKATGGLGHHPPLSVSLHVLLVHGVIGCACLQFHCIFHCC